MFVKRLFNSDHGIIFQFADEMFAKIQKIRTGEK